MSDTATDATVTIEIPAHLLGPVEHFISRLQTATKRTDAQPWAMQFLNTVSSTGHPARRPAERGRLVRDAINEVLSRHQNLVVWVPLNRPPDPAGRSRRTAPAAPPAAQEAPLVGPRRRSTPGRHTSSTVRVAATAAVAADDA